MPDLFCFGSPGGLHVCKFAGLFVCLYLPFFTWYCCGNKFKKKY